MRTKVTDIHPDLLWEKYSNHQLRSYGWDSETNRVYIVLSDGEHTIRYEASPEIVEQFAIQLIQYCGWAKWARNRQLGEMIRTVDEN